MRRVHPGRADAPALRHDARGRTSRGGPGRLRRVLPGTGLPDDSDCAHAPIPPRDTPGRPDVTASCAHGRRPPGPHPPGSHPAPVPGGPPGPSGTPRRERHPPEHRTTPAPHRPHDTHRHHGLGTTAIAIRPDPTRRQSPGARPGRGHRGRPPARRCPRQGQGQGPAARRGPSPSRARSPAFRGRAAVCCYWSDRAVSRSSSAWARAVSESSWPASIRDSSRTRSSPSRTLTPERVTEPSFVFSTSSCRSANAAT